jgi:hypothetical protein
MASLIVSGIVRITRDPETRPGTSGTWYSFGIAAYRKDVLEGKQGVDFFDADLHVKEAKSPQAKAITKGRLMHIETAYLRNDEFTGTDGTKKNRIKLQIVTYELLNDRINNEVTPEPSSPIVEQRTTSICQRKRSSVRLP